MNRITMHAVGLARCGNWKLLDALEVQARASREPAFAGMCHATGAVAVLGYLDGPRDEAMAGAVRCPECDGDGEIEIMGATGRSTYTDCPWCDGEGEVDPDELDRALASATPGECRRWTTLNGDAIEVDVDLIGTGSWMSIAEATRVISEYTKLVTKLARSQQEAPQ
ncbi:MAG: hypothetical protein ACK40R_00220 [Thermomonas sp.]